MSGADQPGPDLRIFEGRVSYAQCWEDPAVLRAALRVGPDDDVLSICSAGDNSFALAIDGARSVTCLDLSGPQLALAELKLVAARALPIQSFHAVLGLDAFGRRVWFYHYLRDQLSDAARAWWDAHEADVRTGLLAHGRYEKYLAAFRERLLPLVHRQRTVNGLLGCTSPEEQAAYYDKRWNSRRWRALFRVFFSRAVMARSGRSQAHFRYVDGPVSEAFLERAAHALRDLPVAENPFIQWILTGGYPNLERAHPYLSVAGHAALAGEAGTRIRFVQADLETHLQTCEPQSISAFNYSNLFEYLSPDAHARILELTIRAARPGARIAYWNLLVPRWRPESLADRIDRHPERAAALLAGDRGFVYGGFQLETVR